MSSALESSAWQRLVRGLSSRGQANAFRTFPLQSGRPSQDRAVGETFLPESVQFLTRQYEELDVSLDPTTKALWCHMRPKGAPSFTPSMVRELNALHRAIEGVLSAQRPEEAPHICYYIQGSRIPGIYNLGGDLAFLDGAVRSGNREALKSYAFDCVKAVHSIAIGFDSSVVTVGLLQGDALGGGLEGALCCNVLIAERSVQMGFPEILFHAFPGMGGYSLIARRVGAARAEEMIFKGKVYTAEEMREMGLVDLVVDDGRGEDAVRDYIAAGTRDYMVRQALYRVRQRVQPLELSELRDVTELWVDTVLNLDEADLRRMKILRTAQQRRLARVTRTDGAPAAPDSTD